MATDKPIVVIVGPTASGKTAAAVSLAKKINGEIVCADSRTVYKDMNIGTAKPTMHDRQGITHWGLDVISPFERYSAAQFQRYARSVISDIHARGSVPIIVGGTGLYIDSIIFDYIFPTPPTVEDRESFEVMSLEEIHIHCIKNSIELPEQNKNKRHLERLIHAPGNTGQRRLVPKNNTIVVGIATGKEDIKQRIEQRTEQMFDDGVVDEAKMLGKKYGWQSEAMKGNIYRIIKNYFNGQIDLQAAKEKNNIADRQLAKRQMTWFRRNPYIVWLVKDELEKNIIARLD